MNLRTVGSEHVKKRTFLEEYLEFLKYFKIDFDENYILHEPM